MDFRFDPVRLVDLAEQTARGYIKAWEWGERQIFEAIRSPIIVG